MIALCTPAAAQVAPDRDWRSVETPHTRVTYPAPYDSLGARAAVAAERAWQSLAAELAPPPGGRVEVLVSDDLDVANAFASVAPYTRVVVYAHPPFDDLDLTEYSDWLDVVIAHEMTHVFHLDEARGLAAVLRGIFGRVPASGWPLFPHVTTPAWTIEGLAVRYETAMTASGRLAGTATEMAVRTAAVEDEVPDLGLVSGDPVIWPAGNTRYVFGSEFLGWLAARHGTEPFRRYVHELAGDLLPFRVDRAARRAFRIGFSDAWEAWRVETTARYRALADSLTRAAPVPQPERLTRAGYWALWPLWSPDGATIAYLAYDGRCDVRLARLDAATGAELTWTRVPRLGVPAWREDGGLVVGGLRWQGPYRRWDDLWLVPADGAARPMTEGARLSHPDVGPGGRIVAVQSEGGTNRLVVLEGVEPVPITPFDPRVHWAYPRWSPDGARIAASRWSGAGFDVVVLDGEGRVEREILADGALNLAPAWSPDGAWLLFGSDRTGIANLYAFDVAGGRGLRQVTNVLGGAFFPDVSPDGRWIVFSGYHHDGWAVERLAFAPDAWIEPSPPRERHAPLAFGRADAAEATSASQARSAVEASSPRSYSPWAMLRPRYWVPIGEAGEEVRGREILGARLGAATSAFDLVGRHAYAVAATVDAEHGRFEPFARYQNAALGRPILDLAGGQSWEFAGFALPPAEEGAPPADTLFVLERDREVVLQAVFPFRHPFRSATLSFGAGVLEERLVLLEPDDLEESGRFRLDDPRTFLPEAFASARFSTARVFAFSVSPEDGWAGSARGEWRFDPEDEARGRREATGQLAAYLAIGRPWGFARTVAAVRASGGVVRGPGAGDGHFALGGASSQGLVLPGLEALGEGRFLFPVRGYERGVRRGRTAWSATAEVRVPLALIQEGWGLRPLFFDRLAATAFVDAGDAWDPCPPEDRVCNEVLEPLVSAGAELLLGVTAFYQVPLTLRIGIARAFVEPVGTTAYLRLGRSF